MQAALERARALEFRISSDECVGRLLAVLAAGVPAGGRVLEIGTGVGMGTAWIVAGVGERTDVEVVTVERDFRLVEAVRSWGWPCFVQLVNADVLEVLESLGSFDLEVRPETRPRQLVARWSECARAAEHRSTRISNAHARSTEGPGAGGPHGRQRSGRAFRPQL